MRALLIVSGLHAVRAAAAPLGHIYALTSNGSTNLLNFIDVDLTTWSISVGPSLNSEIRTAEQAAVYSNGTYWTDAFDDFGAFLVGFDVGSKTMAYSLNVSTWPKSGKFLFLDGIFVASSGSLLVAGNGGCNAQGCGDEKFYAVSEPQSPSPRVEFLGSLPFGGVADVTFDANSDTVYFILGEGSETSSGTLIGVAAAAGSAPRIIANVTLQSFFSFPQWDSGTLSVFGLTLYTGAPGGYARNVTFLSVPPGQVCGYDNPGDHQRLSLVYTVV
jgi:hypothetical protein